MVENEAASLDWQSWLQIVLVFVMGALGWWIKRQVHRIDQLEATSVHRTEYNDTLKELRTRIDENAHQTNDRLDKILILLASGRNGD